MSDPTSAPEILWHYTSAYGFRNIIENRELWASDARFLNDSTELTLLREALLHELQRREHEIAAEPPATTMLDSPSLRRDAVSQARRILESSERPNLYVTSFCEDGDQLSQWYGYARQSGYALGFLSEHLDTRFQAEAGMWGPPHKKSSSSPDNGAFRWMSSESVDVPSWLVQVRYGSDQIASVARHIANQTGLAPISELSKGFGPAAVVNTALVGLASVKDASFQSEREWRRVIRADFGLGVENIRVHYRDTSSGTLVPFLKVPVWPEDALAAVVLGPGPNLSQRSAAVSQFLRERGVTADVRPSHAPLVTI